MCLGNDTKATATRRARRRLPLKCYRHHEVILSHLVLSFLMGAARDGERKGDFEFVVASALHSCPLRQNRIANQ